MQPHPNSSYTRPTHQVSTDLRSVFEVFSKCHIVLNSEQEVFHSSAALLHRLFERLLLTKQTIQMSGAVAGLMCGAISLAYKTVSQNYPSAKQLACVLFGAIHN